MPKTITMPQEELQQDLNQEYSKGFTAGRNQMIEAVTAILDGNFDKVQVSETAEDEIKQFLQRLKDDDRLK